MDKAVWAALITGMLGNIALGAFNALTMRTRTKADIQAAVLTAGVASEKNDIEEGNAAVAQWKGLYETVKGERDEYKGEVLVLRARVKELESRPTVPTVIVEKAEQVPAGRGIEL